MDLKELDVKEIQTFTCEDIQCIVGEEGDLGSGSFGVVKAGFHKTLGAIAVKCILFTGRFAEKKKFMKKISDEVKHLQTANHDNVVRLHGLASWQGSIAIIMEYLPSGNLMEMLRDNDVPIGTLLRLRICDDIANGISFIHNLLSGKRLVHGDLKAENILLTNSLRCKIADFGSSVLTNFTGNTTMLRNYNVTSNQFTAIYAAPEILKNQALKLKPNIDTYSYGMIIFLVLKRELPVLNQSAGLQQVYLDDVKKGARPQMDISELTNSETCEESKKALHLLHDVMKKCWQQNATDRPDMRNVRDELHDRLVQFSSSRINDQVTYSLNNITVTELSQRQHKCVALDRLPVEQSRGTETAGVPDSSLCLSTVRNGSSEKPNQNSKTTASSLLARKVVMKQTKPKNPASTSLSTSGGTKVELGLLQKSSETPEHVNVMSTSNNKRIELYETRPKEVDETISANTLGLPAEAPFRTTSNPITGQNPSPSSSTSSTLEFAKSTSYIAPHRMRTQIKSNASSSNFKDSSNPSPQEFVTFDNNLLRRYDATYFTYKPLPAFKHTHRNGSLINLDNKIYIIGGWRSQNVEMLDLNQPLQWKDVQSTNEDCMLSASTVSNGYIYTVGGGQWKFPKLSGEKYSPGQNCWININNMNMKRQGHALVALYGSLYAIGGHNLNSAEVFDPSRNYWTPIAPLQTPRNGLAAVVLRGKIYAIGGDHDWKELKSIESYDPRESKWETAAYLKVERRDHGACVINERIYVIGGQSDMVEIYDPRAGKWDCDGYKEFRGVHSVVAIMKS